MQFDADKFMNQTYSESNATALTPVPDGEYLARVGAGANDVRAETVKSKDGEKEYLRLTIWWEILDEGLKSRMERDSIRVRDQFLLDVDDATGDLAFGEDKNTRLGNRRDALGLNEDGKAFSLGMLRGAGPAIIRVGTRSDKSDPEKKYTEVQRATAP